MTGGVPTEVKVPWEQVEGDVKCRILRSACRYILHFEREAGIMGHSVRAPAAMVPPGAARTGPAFRES